jgi:hypothetical protein
MDDDSVEANDGNTDEAVGPSERGDCEHTPLAFGALSESGGMSGDVAADKDADGFEDNNEKDMGCEDMYHRPY